MSIIRNKSLLVMAAVGLALCSLLAVSWCRFAYTPMLAQGEPSQTVLLPAGKGSQYLFETLAAQQLLAYPRSWRFFSYWCVDTRHLQAGEYEINDHTTFRTLMRHIATGQVYLRAFTMIEGWTVAMVADALARNPYLAHASAEMTEQQLATVLKAPVTKLEGLLFPDTYFYARGQSDVLILSQSYQKMARVLQAAWEARSPDTVFRSPYEALIAASLIERETAVPTERPLVAAVIANRLKRGMRLQIDPTVAYGLALPRGQKLTHHDLTMATPYNTYQHAGLPPTPIALVSMASLQAALHPAAVDYLYFVATGNGSHQFSSNYAAHQAAVKRYIQQQSIKTIESWGSEPQCNIKQDTSSH